MATLRSTHSSSDSDNGSYEDEPQIEYFDDSADEREDCCSEVLPYQFEPVARRPNPRTVPTDDADGQGGSSSTQTQGNVRSRLGNVSWLVTNLL